MARKRRRSKRDPFWKEKNRAALVRVAKERKAHTKAIRQRGAARVAKEEAYQRTRASQRRRSALKVLNPGLSPGPGGSFYRDKARRQVYWAGVVRREKRWKKIAGMRPAPASPGGRARRRLKKRRRTQRV